MLIMVALVVAMGKLRQLKIFQYVFNISNIRYFALVTYFYFLHLVIFIYFKVSLVLPTSIEEHHFYVEMGVKNVMLFGFLRLFITRLLPVENVAQKGSLCNRDFESRIKLVLFIMFQGPSVIV